MREQLKALCEKYETELKTNVPLSMHTTFRIGGTADYWTEVPSAAFLCETIAICRKEGYPYFILGRGSNILASDEGYRGLILHMGKAFSQVKIHPETGILHCMAGASLAQAARTAAQAGFTGMEGLSGIPGTVGGALYMNAGAYGDEMKNVAISCEYIGSDGIQGILKQPELELSYRHSWFTGHEGVITAVTMQLKRGNKAEIEAKMLDFDMRRREKQPLEFPSAGSTFKRPEGNYASRLIDECGLKGMRRGGAQVSEKHAGFVINTGNATCADVLALCREVREAVQEKTGYVLELEPIVLS